MGKDVAAVSWNEDRGIAVIEFFESFVKEGLDISPLVMPLCLRTAISSHA